MCWPTRVFVMDVTADRLHVQRAPRAHNSGRCLGRHQNRAVVPPFGRLLAKEVERLLPMRLQELLHQ